MPNLLSTGRSRAIEVAVNIRAHSTARILFREIGLAVAVLAIYVLTLLLPLHQAAGLQRDLDALGFATLDTWSICQSQADHHHDGEQHDAAALTCPAAGVAKYELAVIVPPVPVIAPPTTSDVVRFFAAPVRAATLLPDHVGQSRAPPVTA